MNSAVHVHDLTVAYRGHPAVHHLSGAFDSAMLTAVVGPNGAGKSTLLGALGGTIRDYEGRMERDPALRVAYPPQASALDRSFPVRVHEVVAMGLWSRVGSFGGLRPDDRRRVNDALVAVGLSGFEQRWLGELSAGQAQRVLFARVLVQDAGLILLDEPFNAIDARTTANLLALLHRWKHESRLIALAFGVLLVWLRGSQVDLMHMLFGSVLAVDNAALLQIAVVASVTLWALALMVRPLVLESFDPGFLRSVGGPGARAHMLLLVLLVANLVSAFQALGTLMAVGLMMLPAAAARFWVASLPAMAALSVGIGAASGAAGLLMSYHAELPSGPCIVLVGGAAYIASVLFGARDGIVTRRLRATSRFAR